LEYRLNNFCHAFLAPSSSRLTAQIHAESPCNTHRSRSRTGVLW
jgi:hypothetical protein